jgi:hypothetical protein
MDMFMKNLKNLVHSIHSELKQSIPSFKKSHVHGLVSAYLGYGCYAAYQVDLSFNKVTNDTNEIAKGQCFDRALELNFDASNSLLVSKCIAQQLDVSLQSKIQFEKVVRYLESDDELNNALILNSLKSLIDEGFGEASLLAIVICAQVISESQENPDNRSGEYWHNKRLAGVELNLLQEEVADHFSSLKSYFDLLKYVMTQTQDLNLPSPIKIKPIADHFEADNEREWTTLFNDSPYVVLEALDFLYELDDSINPVSHNKALKDWLTCNVSLFPSRNSIAERLNCCESNSEKWFWHYFGLKHNIDVTQDDLYAINADTGEEYDDYGPMAVAGDEGITMPNISDELKAEAKALSTSLLCD